MRLDTLPRILAVMALALFAALGVYGSTLGWGTDRDSVRVIDAARAILAGHYQRSRSFGFPLHEAACALLFPLGGLVAVNLGSVLVTLGGILAAGTLVPPRRAALTVGTLCLLPLLLVNASSAIDFGWDFAAGMALCKAALGCLRGRAALPALFVAMLALLLLRPDNLLFVLAVTGALWSLPGVRHGGVVACLLAACAVSACVYLGLNGVGMLVTAVSSTRPWPARLLRAGVFLAAALGPGGVLALAVLPGARVRGDATALLRRIVLLSWLLYLPRFAALPDQLDYLTLPVCMTIVAALAMVTPAQAVAVALLADAPSLATLSLLRRDPDTGALRPAPALQWGALPQDWAARRFASRMEGPAMTAMVQAKVRTAPLHYDVFLPGYVSTAGELVIGRPHLYRVLPVGIGPGALATVRRQDYGAIWACSVALAPGSGWRGLEAPEPAPRGDFGCAMVSHGAGR